MGPAQVKGFGTAERDAVLKWIKSKLGRTEESKRAANTRRR